MTIYSKNIAGLMKQQSISRIPPRLYQFKKIFPISPDYLHFPQIWGKSSVSGSPGSNPEAKPTFKTQELYHSQSYKI